VVNEVAPQEQIRYYNGQDVLKIYGYDGQDKWLSTYVLLAIAVIVRIITYLFLEYKRFGTT